ncbi:MAG: GspH/FimT family pseudopilin [Gammaproteobacteria bacterium]|nr:GspH/FimT family pseudopilin [Gammaproteobacteria bacterium]
MYPDDSEATKCYLSRMKGRICSLDGFTLVELVVALAVAAILLTIAIPSFQTLIQSNRMAANANEFIAALNLARSEAIKRGVAVTLCKDGGSASACNNAANWEAGWIVFSDLNGDGVVDAGDEVLRVYPALDSGYTFNGNNNVTNRVTYNRRGMGTNGTLVMCDDRGFGEHARAIGIARTGRAQAEHATEADPPVESCQI